MDMFEMRYLSVGYVSKVGKSRQEAKTSTRSRESKCGQRSARLVNMLDR